MCQDSSDEEFSRQMQLQNGWSHVVAHANSAWASRQVTPMAPAGERNHAPSAQRSASQPARHQEAEEKKPEVVEPRQPLAQMMRTQSQKDAAAAVAAEAQRAKSKGGSKFPEYLLEFGRALEGNPSWHTTGLVSERGATDATVCVPPGVKVVFIPFTTQSVVMVEKVMLGLEEKIAELESDSALVAVLFAPQQAITVSEVLGLRQRLVSRCRIPAEMLYMPPTATAMEMELMAALAVRRLEAWEEEREKGRERNNRMFYSAVHRYFQDFPKMKFTQAIKPRVGATIEGCRLDQCLGVGGFGRVYKALNEQTGMVEAVKFITKDSLVDLDDVNRFWNEFRLVSSLSHENIVKCLGAHHLRHHLVIRMAFVGHKNLTELILASGKVPVKQARTYQVQVAKAVAYCHGKQVAHLDIKPENVVVGENGRLVLIDFDSCVKLGRLYHTAVGSMPFMAPEMLLNRGYEADKADIWSCAATFLEILCGVDQLNKMLGWPSNVEATPALVKDLENYFSSPAKLNAALEASLGPCSEDLREVLWFMLQVHPGNRWDATQVGLSKWFKPQSGP